VKECGKVRREKEPQMKILRQKNSLTINERPYLSVLYRLRILWMNLEDCEKVLQPLCRDGERIYTGGNHIAVITASGKRRLILRRY
jgi:hypothetical protein